MAEAPPFSDYAFVSIGSNLPSGAGDPGDTVAFAFGSLAKLTESSLLKSSVYSTSPVDSPPGTPDFLNAMAAFVPRENETASSLLHKLQGIENAAGRIRRGIRNEARTLDLDLILFRDEMVESEELVVPHPRACERKFVLEPLKEIVGGGFVFPGRGETVEKLLSGIGDQQLISKP